MRLDREQFLRAVKFLKPAILISEQSSAMCHVHVRIEKDKATLTAANGVCGKRIVLIAPMQLEFEQETPDTDQEYMIDRATLEAFETLCQKHKTAFDRAGKVDQTLKLIDISSTVLESHKDRLNYRQPACSYPDVDQYFQTGSEPVEEQEIDTDVVIAAMKEFGGVVQVTYSGQKGPVHISQFNGDKQAFYLVCEGGVEEKERKLHQPKKTFDDWYEEIKTYPEKCKLNMKERDRFVWESCEKNRLYNG